MLASVGNIAIKHAEWLRELDIKESVPLFFSLWILKRESETSFLVTGSGGGFNC